MNVKPLSDRVLVKPNPAEEMTASGLIIPDTAKDSDYIVVDVYFYTSHVIVVGGKTYNGGTEQYGCYTAGTWQTFKCTVAEWKAKSTIYTEASIGVCNFRIETAE